MATVQKVRKFAQQPISLDTPIGQDKDSHLGDFIENRQEVSPAEAMIDLNLKEQIENVVRTLTPREAKVIRMRFGLGTTASTHWRRSGGLSRSHASGSARSRPRRCASCGTPRVARG